MRCSPGVSGGGGGGVNVGGGSVGVVVIDGVAETGSVASKGTTGVMVATAVGNCGDGAAVAGSVGGSGLSVTESRTAGETDDAAVDVTAVVGTVASPGAFCPPHAAARAAKPITR